MDYDNFGEIEDSKFEERQEIEENKEDSKYYVRARRFSSFYKEN